MKIYDTDVKVDFTTEPMFFGENRNLQRYDVQKYPIFYTLGEKLDSQFWKPQEISLLKDAMDFKALEPHEEHIFTSNLKRQIILDSIQGRAPILTFNRITNLPELEYAVTRLTFQETNHSDSYSYILRNVYDNPPAIFDEIMDNPLITEHTIKIDEKYEILYDLINKWEVYPKGHPSRPSLHEMKVATYLALISWNILEGIRFYVSFACTFAFAENKIMEGNAKELQLIARDENVHLALTQAMINNLRKNEDEGFQDVILECRDEVIDMYKAAALDEMEWADYLFEDGSLIGLNAEILKNYMKFITNQRMKAIGLDKLYDGINQNPLPWMDAWLGTGKTEALPQEVENVSYIIGQLNDDMSEEDWDA